MFTVAFLSTTVWVFSLTIPHGMYLVVPIHHSLFWVVCHSSKTFSPKEFEREPQNRLFSLPTIRPYPLLPLTHDPPLLYWLGTGWWCLSLVRASLLRMSKAYLLLMHLPWTGGSFARSGAHYWPFMVWIVFLIFHSLLACSFQELGLAWLWVFPSLSSFFTPSVILLPFLSYYSAILVVVLFNPCLLGFFWAYCLFFSQWLNIVIGFIPMLLWAFLSHYITCEFLWPISFSLGILGPF